MDWRRLEHMDPSQWPDNTAELVLAGLREADASDDDLSLAIALAGDMVVINQTLVAELVTLIERAELSDTVRANAAIALGPVLEQSDLDELEMEDGVCIPTEAFHTLREKLEQLFRDASLPKVVRRRILEAAVRAPMEWQVEAIREAWQNAADLEWRTTAIFAMRFVRGFEDEIDEALKSQDPLIKAEAILAAGAAEQTSAWPIVAGILEKAGEASKAKLSDDEEHLLYAAIESSVGIDAERAAPLLETLTEHTDEDVAEAAREAHVLTRVLSEFCALEEDFDDDWD